MPLKRHRVYGCMRSFQASCMKCCDPLSHRNLPSGPDIFILEVADYLEAYPVGWEPCLYSSKNFEPRQQQWATKCLAAEWRCCAFRRYHTSKRALHLFLSWGYLVTSCWVASRISVKSPCRLPVALSQERAMPVDHGCHCSMGFGACNLKFVQTDTCYCSTTSSTAPSRAPLDQAP